MAFTESIRASATTSPGTAAADRTATSVKIRNDKQLVDRRPVRGDAGTARRLLPGRGPRSGRGDRHRRAHSLGPAGHHRDSAGDGNRGAGVECRTRACRPHRVPGSGSRSPRPPRSRCAARSRPNPSCSLAPGPLALSLHPAAVAEAVPDRAGGQRCGACRAACCGCVGPSRRAGPPGWSWRGWRWRPACRRRFIAHAVLVREHLRQPGRQFLLHRHPAAASQRGPGAFTRSARGCRSTPRATCRASWHCFTGSN